MGQRAPGSAGAHDPAQAVEHFSQGVVALGSILGSIGFMRIALCGQTSAHFAQSMQMEGSQIGISLAIERFSHRTVSVGNVLSRSQASA